jgi:hypothetical protein
VGSRRRSHCNGGTHGDGGSGNIEGSRFSVPCFPVRENYGEAGLGLRACLRDKQKGRSQSIITLNPAR